jgi:hypothetical protein
VIRLADIVAPEMAQNAKGRGRLERPGIVRRDREEKLAALKLLGHCIGDIHQPPARQGAGGQGRQSLRTQRISCASLYILWDSCIFEEQLGMDPRTIVGELRAGIADEQRAAWLASDAAVCANEAFPTVVLPARYCVMVGEACQYGLTTPS